MLPVHAGMCLRRLAILNCSLEVLIFGTFHWGFALDELGLVQGETVPSKYSAYLCGGFILSGKTDFKLIMTRMVWKHGKGELGKKSGKTP